MRVERKPGTWETLTAPVRTDDEIQPVARHTVSEPTHGESQKQVDRSLNDLVISSARLIEVGLLNGTKSGQRPSGSQISS